MLAFVCVHGHKSCCYLCYVWLVGRITLAIATKDLCMTSFSYNHYYKVVLSMFRSHNIWPIPTIILPYLMILIINVYFINFLVISDNTATCTAGTGGDIFGRSVSHAC